MSYLQLSISVLSMPCAGLTPLSLKDAMARTAHSATMLGTRLVVVGGVHSNGSLSSDVLVLHTDRRQVGILAV